MDIREIKIKSPRVYEETRVFDVIHRRKLVGTLIAILAFTPGTDRDKRVVRYVGRYGDDCKAFEMFEGLTQIRTASEAKKAAKVWFKGHIEKDLQELPYGNT